jgi:hypothetical protein
MELDLSEPLIWTSRGNLPISALKYEVMWEDHSPQYMKFCERYLAEDGEVVKESAHAYSFSGVLGEGVPGNPT